ncbi:hypothetical protein TNCV_679921 [Trichonephila clavipes]|nr:hypothetical protein TNCV_679921 [Trichonephila clavipes]
MAPLPENPAPLNASPETAPAPPREKRNQNEIEDDDSGNPGFMCKIETKSSFESQQILEPPRAQKWSLEFRAGQSGCSEEPCGSEKVRSKLSLEMEE